jgi:patatin-like phospholipase/acyl hydrolase
MPPGYDVYNVPYAYQDRYYDTPDANYRYADGYVYQVDPTTQLIQAAIELLI